MAKNEETQSRINLIVPMDMSIKIEKESDKRGINRTQFIKEAIHDKINKIENDTVTNEIITIKDNINEIKDMIKELKRILLIENK